MVLHDHNHTDFKPNWEPLQICEKGRNMDALEELEIHRAHANVSGRGFVLNEQLNFKSNPLHDTALSLIHI